MWVEHGLHMGRPTRSTHGSCQGCSRGKPGRHPGKPGSARGHAKGTPWLKRDHAQAAWVTSGHTKRTPRPRLGAPGEHQGNAMGALGSRRGVPSKETPGPTGRLPERTAGEHEAPTGGTPRARRGNTEVARRPRQAKTTAPPGSHPSHWSYRATPGRRPGYTRSTPGLHPG